MDIAFDPRFKFRLDLPATQERYRLVIENDSPDTLTTAERNRQRVLSDLEGPDQPTTGFFRLLFNTEKWRLKGDVGMRFSSGPNPFVRARANRRWELGNDWTLRNESEVSYFLDDKLGFDQLFIFDRLMSVDTLLRLSTDLQWREVDQAWNFSEVISYSWRVGYLSVVAPAMGWTGEDKPRLQTRSYFFNVTWRQRLHSNWLFFEVIPEILYARDTGFQDDASLTLGLEVLFVE